MKNTFDKKLKSFNIVEYPDGCFSMVNVIIATYYMKPYILFTVLFYSW